MPEEQNTKPKGRWRVVVLSLIAFPLVYFGGLALVRGFVSHQIERNQGEVLGTFELQDRGGRSWTAEGLKGKVVVLHFFRSFCSSCSAEAPSLRRLEDALDSERVVLLGVMTDQLQKFSAADTEATLRKYDFDHPILMADEGLADSFHGTEWSHVTPVTYVADKDGVVRGTLRGPQRYEDLVAAIRAAGGTVKG